MDISCLQCGLIFKANRKNRVVCSLSCAALRRSSLRMSDRAGAESKVCSICDTEKSISDFSIKIKDRHLYSSECKDCHKIYRQSYYQKNKHSEINRIKERKNEIKEHVRALKLDMFCNRCGENHPAVLQFHHKDSSEKDFGIAEAVAKGLSIKKIEEEMTKCEVLCANCHFKAHY